MDTAVEVDEAKCYVYCAHCDKLYSVQPTKDSKGKRPQLYPIALKQSRVELVIWLLEYQVCHTMKVINLDPFRSPRYI